MALYEPTNISPDLKYSVGNGTVDVNYGLTIAWQVNGNAMTPMTGYQITIRENNAAGTLAYMTPIERLREPFFGADALGNPIRYEIDLPAENVLSGHYFGYRSDSITGVSVDFDTFTSKLSEYNLYQFVYTGTFWRFMGGQESSLAGYGITYTGTPAAQDAISVVIGAPMVNGREYKMEIAQSWSHGSSGGAAIAMQKSPSVFITRAKPELTLDSFAIPVTSRAKTFTASYQQAQYDPLSWVQWKIARADDLNNPLYDSGRIYGAGALETSYDGFFSGSTYSIICDGETVNGVPCSTGWNTFPVEYSLAQISASLVAGCTARRNAVRLKTSGILYYPGYGSGYSYVGSDLDLGTSGTASWDELGAGIQKAPWALAALFQSLEGYGSMSFLLNDKGSAAVGGNAISLLPQKGSGTQHTLFVEYANPSMVDPEAAGSIPYASGAFIAVYVRPSTDAAHPASDYVECHIEASSPAGQQTFYLPMTQGVLRKVLIRGRQKCRFVQTFDASTPTAVDAWLLQGKSLVDYVAARDATTMMMTKWHLGDFTLQAGVLDADPAGITAQIYRESGGSLYNVATVPITFDEVYDYAAGNQTVALHYYAFPQGENGQEYAPLVSNAVSLCRWSWTLLSCVEEADNRYRVEQEFHFGNNLSTGAISNNNAPSLWNNFTRYPTIQRAPQNYQSGSLTSLIGVIADGEYTDTIAARDAIWALSTTQNTLFLKNRKGDVLMVAISGAITMQTGDNTPQQTQTATIPWVEIGSADGVQIYSLS